MVKTLSMIRVSLDRRQEKTGTDLASALLVAIGLFSVLTEPAVAQDGITAGFSRVDSTPPVGCRVAGNDFESFSQSINDPLHARAMYLADGDINHLDFVGGTRPDEWTESTRIENRLADAIQSMMDGLREPLGQNIKFGRSIVPAPFQDVDANPLVAVEATLFAPQGEAGFLERVDAWKQMNTQQLRRRDGDNLQVEIQAIVIGDRYALVSLPHEVFVELGMSIRARSPYAITAVITLAQDLDFYVPTRKAFAEGSYEITTSSKPGGGEQIAEAAVELLRSMD